MRNKIMSLSAFMVLTVLCVGSAVYAGSSSPRDRTPSEVTSITGINVTGDTVEIRGDRPFIYTIYAPSDPYRVLVEIPDADIGNVKSVIRPRNSMITEIRPSQVDVPKPIAKIEVLLESPAGVNSQYRNNSLLLTAKSADTTPQLAASQTESRVKIAEAKESVNPDPEKRGGEPMPQALEEKSSMPKATEITNISFDRGPGIVKIVVKGNGAMSPSVFTLTNRIVVDIPDVEMRAAVPSTVMSPVKGLRAGKHKDRTRLVVDLSGSREFDVLSMKDTIVIALKTPETSVDVVKNEMPSGVDVPQEQEKLQEQRPMPVETTTEEKTEAKEIETLAAGKYTGAKISLDFQDSDIVPIFRLLSDISGYNIVVDPGVKGKLTMKLINVPWDQALDLILKTFSLGKIVEGNIIRIAPLSVFAKETDEKTKVRDALAKAEPLETRFFLVSYASVKDVEKAIKDSKILTPRGNISVDERTRSIVVKDGASVFPQVDSILATLDKPTPQVMIEGRIVELNTNNETDLGIQWGIRVNAKNTLSTLGGLPGLGTGAFTGNNFLVDVPATLAGRGSGVSFGMLSPDRTFGLDLQLSAIETVGNGKVISNPRILTIDNGKAKILQGKSIPTRKLTTEGTISTEYKDINIELNVTPHIAPDKSITLEIEIKKEELDPTLPSIEGQPSTDKKEAKTSVIIQDGATIVIGGMYKVNTSDTKSGVPFLMKIPILGSLFRDDHTIMTTTELLIFITPRIVEKP